MKNLITIIFLLPAICFGQILANSEYADPVPSVDRHLPFGIRSAGMGGTGVAVSEDLSALFYNPANLAYIYRIELTGALQYEGLKYESNFNSTLTSGTDSYIRLQNAGVILPIPTSRGGVSFAGGFTRTNSFDRRLVFEGTGEDGLDYSGEEIVKGGLGKFSFGGGLQVSPIAALGLSMDFYAGGERFSWYLDRINPGGSDWPDSLERKIISDDIRDEYTGIGARFGTTIVPNKYVQIGVYVNTPVALTIEEDGVQRFDSIATGVEEYNEEYNIVETFELVLPWRLGAGMALRPTDWFVLAGDIEYVDWRQIEYNDPTWILEQNRLMDDSFQPTLRWSAGVEFTIPVISTKLRGGFSQEPIAYIKNADDRNRNCISGGAGILMNELLSMDIAARFSNWESGDTELKEEYKVSDIWVGLSYRF